MSLSSEGQSLSANQISSTYLNSQLRYNYVCFEQQTSAILEFYFRFRSRPFRRNLHVILDQATELRPNQSTHCGNMTSYPFFKTAAATAKYYFRFRICWCHCLQKVKVHQQTKFWHISIHGWDITTSVFDLYHFAVIAVLFCIRLPNWNIHCRNMTSYRFS